MRNKYESNVLELRCMGQLSPPKGHGTLCGAVRPHHKYSVSISVINYRAHWTCRGSALAFFDPTSRLSIRSFTPVWHTDCRHMRHPPKDAASPGWCRRRRRRRRRRYLLRQKVISKR